ncbi:hypothetical protein SEMRO_167_G074450.1 [Seminavis robusta]|uniref:Uncharacterized protein n=1 Tax=Seminavis robusta TaxID=568900 RepID=A0A9N8H6B8_9STRA|nr:hypothetical protein SEMRO_167_G074450.1 [Seminavis robusta]|eukprot:Sro167_g074450.1 n/a (215) ;mRNA; f:40891-41535
MPKFTSIRAVVVLHEDDGVRAIATLTTDDRKSYGVNLELEDGKLMVRTNREVMPIVVLGPMLSIPTTLNSSTESEESTVELLEPVALLEQEDSVDLLASEAESVESVASDEKKEAAKEDTKKEAVNRRIVELIQSSEDELSSEDDKVEEIKPFPKTRATRRNAAPKPVTMPVKSGRRNPTRNRRARRIVYKERESIDSIESAEFEEVPCSQDFF